jgi:PAS domain S-box-containing protein
MNATAELPAPPPVRTPDLDRALVAAFLGRIPDRIFFKDRRSRFIAISQSCVRNFGGATADQIVGRTDFDFFAGHHARHAYEDEQHIIRTGDSILNKVERETWHDGRVTWSLTSKMPLRTLDGTIIGTFGVSRDITRRREIELALEQAHKELVSASRLAGMAEVATGVLHNVGNVLNSLNVSASVIASQLRQAKAESLARLAGLLRAHAADLPAYLTSDPKGRRIPELVTSLARHATAERARLVAEVAQLQKHIDHIKEIVAMQQAYATLVGVVENLDPASLLEDALRMNADGLARRSIAVGREFAFVPAVVAERAKVLQILVNLIRNAQHACEDAGTSERRITLRLALAASGERVCLAVSDNGVGIAPENLTRIFGHGFTTRATGHGFGLHASANAAREMNGALSVHSDGPGRGATFTLELPVAPPAVPAS